MQNTTFEYLCKTYKTSGIKRVDRLCDKWTFTVSGFGFHFYEPTISIRFSIRKKKKEMFTALTKKVSLPIKFFMFTKTDV